MSKATVANSINLRNRKNILTPENRAAIAAAINNLPKSKETEVMQDIAANPPVATPEEIDNSHKYEKIVEAKFDALSNTTSFLTEHQEKPISEMTDEEFNEMMDKVELDEVEYTIEAQDIMDAKDSQFGDLNVSYEEAVELAKLAEEYRLNKDSVKFRYLPERIQKLLNTHMTEILGILPDGSNTAQINEIKNTLAEALIQEYCQTISMKKTEEGYENFQKDIPKELSSAYKVYNNAMKMQISRYEQMMEDPEKKALAKACLDAIDDAYNLNRLIEAAPRIRIKKFDIEKPNRVFNSIHAKYISPKTHIYNVYGCTLTLASHLLKDHIIEGEDELENRELARTLAVKIMLIFCKVCQNYSTEHIEEHNFMYFFTYNIYLLNMYQGEEHEEHAQGFYENIKKLIAVMR